MRAAIIRHGRHEAVAIVRAHENDPPHRARPRANHTRRRSRDRRRAARQESRAACRRQEAAAPFVRHLEGPRAASDRAGRHVGARQRHRRRAGQSRDVLRRRRLRRRLEDRERRSHAGRRSSTARARTRSAASRSIRTIPRSSGSAPARTTASAASPTATASTSPTTAARRGRTWASRAPSTSAASASTRATRASCTSRRRARSGRRAATAASTRRPTAERRGRPCSRSRENTGVTDVAMDPRNPDILYAAALPAAAARLDADQRRTRVGASTARRTPARPGRRSTRDFRRRSSGASAWPSRRRIPTPCTRSSRPRTRPAASSARRTAASPGRSAATTSRAASVLHATWPSIRKNSDRVYSMDVFIQVTDDGGKTFHKLGESAKHVDNHAIWIDPDDTRHYRVGCDGGVYETFDRGATWEFKANLPVAQFYHVVAGRGRTLLQRLRRHAGQQHPRRAVAHAATCTASPTPTGSSPSAATASRSRVDPKDPNIVYAESQYGGLVALRPQERRAARHPAAGRQGRAAAALELGLAAPHLSPHAHTRLYFAAQRVFRSDDRGDTLEADQPRPDAADRSQQAARSWAKVWSVDAVGQERLDVVLRQHRRRWPNRRRQEGLLYVGTDDGLVQVTEDGGATWRTHREASPACPSRHVRRAPRALAARRLDASTPRSTTTRWATSSRTCSRAPTAGGPGPRSPATCRSAGRSTSLAEDPVDREPAVRRHRVRALLHARTAARTGCR